MFHHCIEEHLQWRERESGPGRKRCILHLLLILIFLNAPSAWCISSSLSIRYAVPYYYVDSQSSSLKYSDVLTEDEINILLGQLTVTSKLVTEVLYVHLHNRCTCILWSNIPKRILVPSIICINTLELTLYSETDMCIFFWLWTS